MPASKKNIARSFRASIRGPGGFTLIELLVVLAVIALLMAILVPYLRASREEARKIKCVANLRSILQASGMYVDDQEGQQLYPWYQVPPHQGYRPSVVTPWVFGGFRAPKPERDSEFMDSALYPAQVRPLNKYVDPTAFAEPFDRKDRGRDIIKTYICPSDRTNSTTFIGDPGEPVEEWEPRTSWEANGSSFTLNTRWLQGYVGFDFSRVIHNPDRFSELSSRIARHIVGGNASQFILWAEQGFYGATYNAKPENHNKDAPPSIPQIEGWHQGFSSWSVGFADGHVSHGFFDTRGIYGLGGTIWQPAMRD
ncbi:MAG: hypothetical protein DCC65_14320 [Planctomycetota bacterium]|nr:MAG: hypothetical protein DCC65_14320 [Planctomycetota bacterium]